LSTTAADSTVRVSLDRAVDHLLSLQSPAGWWKGELETNVTMDAEDLLLRQFLGIRTEEQTEMSAVWIRSKQRVDGTWGNFYGAPADLSTTVESYAALRLAGDPPGAEHMTRAREYILDTGGLERTRVFTKIWFSLVGLWSWDDVPVMPPELMLLPPSVPLNIYDFACWARQTVAALTVVSAFKPIRPVRFTLDELRTGAQPEPFEPLTTWPGAFRRLDKLLHAYERRPSQALRGAALRRAERFILDRQEADGSWGGIQPPWVYSLMALNLLGYPVEHPVIQKGLAGLDAFTIVENGSRRLEACQSPIWDTALALVALGDAGLPADHPAIERGARWLLGEEVRHRGDWAIRRPSLEPGGWAFEFQNDWYPDLDDTAEVIIALRRSALPGMEDAIGRGIAWAIGMQSEDDGWGAFDADNVQDLINKLPFCDFGEVIDPPSADVTAHVVEMLAGEGLAGHDAACRGIEWLLREQEADGSWFGRWGCNYVYGTGAVVPALVAAGIPPGHDSIRRAIGWLERVQNADGGWGEDMRSYDDPEGWSARGESTASQTAWALLALHAAGEREGAAERGLAWLAETQLESGTWDEPWYTGTGFPGDFYINYHLYRLVFPVTALARFAQ
jgi:squalene-hopene/tetraprenyl-beta-curcumene cyclase